MFWWLSVRKSTSELGANASTRRDNSIYARRWVLAWLADDARRRSDYAFYRQELAAVRLAAGRADARRWLLKDPCHLFSPTHYSSVAQSAGRLAPPRTRPRYQPRSAPCCPKSGASSTARRRRTSPPRFNEAVVALGKLLDAGLAFRRRRPGAAVHDL